MKTYFYHFGLVILSCMFLSGCGGKSTENSNNENSPSPTLGPSTTINPTASPQPSVTPAPTFTPKPSVTPSPTFTPKPSVTPSPTFTPKPSVTPSPTFTPKPSITPAPTFTPKPSITPAPTFTPKPSATPTPMPTIDLVFGANEYKNKCQSCHGTTGGGIYKISSTCTNCSSQTVLATYIKNQMPQGNPALCVGNCASATAAYILNNFKTTTSPQPSAFTASPLRRLTHDAFIESARQLFNKPLLKVNINSLPEIENDGLVNDAQDQLLSQLLLGNYLDAATSIADQVIVGNTMLSLESLLGCSPSSDPSCIGQFQNRIAQKAFRRPLTATEKQSFLTLHQEITMLNSQQDALTKLKLGLKSFVQSVLVSPHFINFIEKGDVAFNGGKKLSNYEIATRLSYMVTDRLPDDELINAASTGLLVQPNVRAEHVNRLLATQYGKQKIDRILLSWFGIEKSDVILGDNLSANPNITTQLTKQQKINLGTNARIKFLDFASNWFFTNKEFSDIYSQPIQVAMSDGSFTSQPLGILGLPAFIASHTEQTSPAPIFRGVFTIERLLCQSLPLPPANIPEAPALTPGLSQRDWLAEHRQDSCATCHNKIDNYGFVYENFDISGTFHELINTQQIDASANLPAIGDIQGAVNNLSEFAQKIASSNHAQSCMTDLWFRNTYGRNTNEKDVSHINQLLTQWQSSGGSAKNLLITLVKSDNFITLYQ